VDETFEFAIPHEHPEEEDFEFLDSDFIFKPTS